MTSINFDGRQIFTPGAYTRVDASGLDQVGLGASGIVAILGTGVGGVPVSAITKVADVVKLTKPEQFRTTYRSGDLREAGDIVFAPSKDTDIQAGAQVVVVMKVNPATQGATTLGNAQGDAVTLTAKDYGEFTNQINMTVATGTNQGKLLTITFEDVIETVDDLGGDNMFTLKYVNGGAGYTAVTGQVTGNGDLTANGTRNNLAGLDGDIGTQLVSAGNIEVLSANAGDTTQVVTVIGLDAGTNPISENVTLNGTTVAVGATTFTTVLGARVAGTTAGIVTVRASGGGATVLTVASGLNPAKGLSKGDGMYANGVLTLVSSGASVKNVIVQGKNSSGVTVLEKITLTGTTAVAGTTVYSEILSVVLGDVEAAQMLTATAEAAKSLASSQDTMQKLVDFFNGRNSGTSGFTAVLVTTKTALGVSNLDVQPTAVSILTTAVGFLSDLYAVINWVNTNSALISAAKASGASGGAPTNTTAPAFLAGATEGVTLASHWQAALDLLKQVRVNTIVPLTRDTAIHAATEAHCAFMGGAGRSERDAVLGAMNTAGTDVPTKTEYKAQVASLNSRHVRLAGQTMERFNTAGVRTEFNPYFTALLAAGMQAGSPVGTALTSKFVNALAFRQDVSWNPMDDSEEMIQGGALFLRNVEGVGIQWVRNVTTHLSSTNIAFVEASVNESANFAAFEFRNAMETRVGKTGFAGTPNAAKGVALSILNLMVNEGTITSFQSLNIDKVSDSLEVSVEIAPDIPTNFVPITIHLVTSRQSAA